MTRRACICGRQFSTDCDDHFCSDACEEHARDEQPITAATPFEAWQMIDTEHEREET